MNRVTMWTDDLSVDNREIDNEHKQLFSLLDSFYKGIMDNSPKVRLQELIVGLLDYTKTHFAREEVYMKRMGFPELENHKKQHELFIDRANSFYTKMADGKMILSLEVTNFLKDWLVNHIKGSDQRYAQFASENQAHLQQVTYK